MEIIIIKSKVNLFLRWMSSVTLEHLNQQIRYMNVNSLHSLINDGFIL